MPYGEELKESWTWNIPGGFFPMWVVRAARGDKTFWRDDDIDGESEEEVRSASASTAGQTQGAETEAVGEKFKEPFEDEKKGREV